MSFFDPYHISEYEGYYSKKGQVIQKRHVDRNPALTLKDKERAIKILNSFGFKAIPNDYMPLEKYNHFEGRTLSYENIGNLGNGESFQIKLNNLLSFLPSLPIMTQVSSQNVEEFNINCILTSIYLRCDSDNIASYLLFKIGEGTYQYNVVSSQIAYNNLRVSIFPNIDDGFVNRMDTSGVNGSFQRVSFPFARKGQLNENLITADKYLFNEILHNDFSDARFNTNIVEIVNDTGDPNDIINLKEIGLYFSVDVEVIYKSYLD